MAKKSKLADATPSMDKMKPTLHLNHDDMKKLGMNMPKIGDKVKAHIHGKIVSTSHYAHSDGQKSSHVTMEINKLKPGKGKKSKPGVIDDEKAEGAMSAMDDALEEAGESNLPKSEDKGKKK